MLLASRYVFSMPLSAEEKLMASPCSPAVQRQTLTPQEKVLDKLQEIRKVGERRIVGGRREVTMHQSCSEPATCRRCPCVR